MRKRFPLLIREENSGYIVAQYRGYVNLMPEEEIHCFETLEHVLDFVKEYFEKELPQAEIESEEQTDQ